MTTAQLKLNTFEKSLITLHLKSGTTLKGYVICIEDNDTVLTLQCTYNKARILVSEICAVCW